MSKVKCIIFETVIPTCMHTNIYTYITHSAPICYIYRRINQSRMKRNVFTVNKLYTYIQYIIRCTYNHYIVHIE